MHTICSIHIFIVSYLVPPTWFGVCYTDFRETIVLLDQKLYKFCKFVKDIFNTLCAFSWNKKEVDGRYQSFSFYSTLIFSEHKYPLLIKNILGEIVI
jgi:hypothetical protein